MGVSGFLKVRSSLGQFRRDKRGQGMTEYILMVGLIALAAMTAVYFFGDNLRALFGGASEQLMLPTEAVNTADQLDTTAERAGMWGDALK